VSHARSSRMPAVVHHAVRTTQPECAPDPALILSLAVDDQQIWAEAVTRLGVARPQFFSTTLDLLVADLRLILTPEYATRAAN